VLFLTGQEVVSHEYKSSLELIVEGDGQRGFDSVFLLQLDELLMGNLPALFISRVDWTVESRQLNRGGFKRLGLRGLSGVVKLLSLIRIGKLDLSLRQVGPGLRRSR